MSILLNTPQKDQGFTAIEALVTVIVAATFLLAINTLYITVSQSLSVARTRSTSNDLAYSYLRKYASSGSTPTWFVCDTTNGSGNTNDITKNSNATGQVLESGSLTSSASGLPGPVTYSVKALAIYGCSGLNLKKPIRVDSLVTYGPNSQTARHSTIVGY